jgi:hypothetical protein
VIESTAFRLLPPQQLRQLGEVRRHAAGVVLGQPVGGGAPLRFIVKIEITERLPVGVADDEALRVLIDDPRRREAAGGVMIALFPLCAESDAQRSSKLARRTLRTAEKQRAFPPSDPREVGRRPANGGVLSFATIHCA